MFDDRQEPVTTFPRRASFARKRQVAGEGEGKREREGEGENAIRLEA